MDTRKAKQRTVALLAISLALAPAVSADLTLIYTGSFDLRIPAEPATGHAWMNDAVIEVPVSFDVIDLDVEITLTHTSVFDLQLFIEGPDGTRLTLNYYDPDHEFFEGRAPQGLWAIQIYDAWHANIGVLEEVKLIFQTPEPAVFLLLLLGFPLTRPQKP